MVGLLFVGFVGVLIIFIFMGECESGIKRCTSRCADAAPHLLVLLLVFAEQWKYVLQVHDDLSVIEDSLYQGPINNLDSG